MYYSNDNDISSLINTVEIKYASTINFSFFQVHSFLYFVLYKNESDNLFPYIYIYIYNI